MKKFFMILIIMFTLLGAISASAAEINDRTKIAVIVPEYYIVNDVKHIVHESIAEKIIVDRLRDDGYKKTTYFDQQPKHFEYGQLSTATLKQVADDLNVDIIVVGKTSVSSTADRFNDCKAKTITKVFYTNSNKLVEIRRSGTGQGKLSYNAIEKAVDISGNKVADEILKYLGK
ncbi:hypothetical protein [Phascolarctobacterium sp.]